ncbi:hypothetical protein [Cognatilysobacter bugurensis]|uniref:Uncharacterized protein n=1 Tax=Cognatilysobacter bugurensis TaxID=543356 RepID=A0A918T1A5_9GAMM|nr:hypothetical protein [Lysobacter bugurensis]GHA83849.1 hypothetical protein GCM10007067_22480 [Lysobacter bugurensis]
MSAQLTGHVIVEIDGDEQQIDAESFVEEHDGLWKYHGDGFTLQVTADLEGATDDEGNYPTFVDEPEIEGNVSVEIIESELAAARGDLYSLDGDDEEEDEDDEDEDLEDR